MIFCQECRFLGYCRKLQCKIVTNTEIADERFIRAIRQHAYELKIPGRRWPDVLSNWLRDYPGRFFDALGQIKELDLIHIEYPEGQETDEAPYARWYQEFCNTPCPKGTTPFVRREARERVRIVATLLRARYPVRASTWGKVAANDNRSPNQSRM